MSGFHFEKTDVIGMSRQATKIRPSKRQRYWVFGLVILITGLALWQTAHWSRQFALNEIRQSSKQTLDLIVEALYGDLEKYDYLPPLLAEDDVVQRAFSENLSASKLDRINKELEQIQKTVGASDIYLMDKTGLTFAASNWASPKTFIGKNFSYRPYFQEALKGQQSHYFALGSTSGERGNFYAVPVYTDKVPIRR